ncbi:uncharacterized protein Dwil_GK15425 [Drosophila willistoni]|uniref:Uncharacterized protein n=1 Tax=Drosophila willistoni TaxID=7260 RepID=B4MV36_DROWI|nr:uncharacterized protein LOC6642122 [Drosophila willistoni]EDW76381.2 uncharacterized protein Dwil_GK15425 [Drosophila willistoni]
MLFMESYLCYCSVRLGVLIVSLINIIKCLAFSIYLFVHGIQSYHPLVELFEQDAQYAENRVVRRYIHWIENYPDKVLIYNQVLLYSNIAAALLASFGSFKLYKWLLLPLALFELLYLIQFTSFHIVLMIVLKKLINLGLLIVLTLVGSFYILFEGYNCVTCLAMFQIISLVKSQRYRELYGNDPFHPLALKRAPNNSYSKDSVQQLRILETPDDTDIDEQKRLAKLGLWPRRQPQVISVIPAQAPMPQLKWWQQQALDKDDKLQDSKIYRNWQPNELLSGVGGEVQRKNALNRRYAEGELYRWY